MSDCPKCKRNLREGYGLMGGCQDQDGSRGFICGSSGVGRYWYCSSDNCGYFHKVLDSDEPAPPKPARKKPKSLWERFWGWLS